LTVVFARPARGLTIIFVTRAKAQATAGEKPAGNHEQEDDKPDERTVQQKQQDLNAGIGEAEQLLKDENVPEEEVEDKLPSIKKKYRLISLSLEIDNSTEEEDSVHVHGEVNPKGDTKSYKKAKLKKGKLIQIKDGSDWSADALKISKIFNQSKFEASNKTGNIVRELYLKDRNITWRIYNPYKQGEAWVAIRDLSVWSNYNDARQALNYRKHKDFRNPSGKDWHHIIEQSNTSNVTHSVDNLALVDSGLNRGALAKYFERKDFRETGGLPLRKWLETKSKDIAHEWGLNAIEFIGKTIVRKQDDEGREYQELE
jgi:hypothetical protein